MGVCLWCGEKFSIKNSLGMQRIIVVRLSSSRNVNSSHWKGRNAFLFLIYRKKCVVTVTFLWFWCSHTQRAYDNQNWKVCWLSSSQNGIWLLALISIKQMTLAKAQNFIKFAWFLFVYLFVKIKMAASYIQRSCHMNNSWKNTSTECVFMSSVYFNAPFVSQKYLSWLYPTFIS